jgi:hypothetical protein
MKLHVLPALLYVAVASGAAAESSKRIAIYPLQPLGTEQQIADRLDTILREEVARLPTVRLQARAETLLVAGQVEKVGHECHGDAVCLARIGKACGVAKFLYGTVASLGDSYTVDLKLVDVASRSLERRLSERLSGDEAVLIDGVRELSAKLISPGEYVGTLELRGIEVGALIYIDGKEIGSAPVEPQVLEPGKHAVKITKDGFRDYDRFVEVSFGRVSTINVRLRPIPANELDQGPSAFDSPLFTAGVVTASLGGVAALTGVGLSSFFLLSHASLSNATEARGADDERVVVDTAAYEDWQGLYHEWMWPTGLTLLLGGIAVAGAGAGIAVWDLNRQAADE